MTNDEILKDAILRMGDGMNREIASINARFDAIADAIQLVANSVNEAMSEVDELYALNSALAQRVADLETRQ